MHSSFVTRCLLIFLVACLSACSGSAPARRPYSGLSRTFEPGIPSFEAQVRPSLEKGQRGMRVDVQTPLITLVFGRSGGRRIARIEWLVRLMDAAGDRVLAERTEEQIVDQGTDSNNSLFQTASFSAYFPVPPALYVVEIVLEDLTSGQIERRQLSFELPTQNAPLLTTELLIESESGSQVIGLQMPDTLGTTRAVFYLAGNVARPVRIRTSFLEIAIDTTAALPPYWTGPLPDLRGFQGLRHEILDTLSTELKTIRRGPLARITADLPHVSSGLYRVDVEIEDLNIEGDLPAVRLTRLLIVRPSDFPRVRDFNNLIPPLIYLAEAGEWDALRTSVGTEQARSRFDAFWGRYSADRTKASKSLGLFYSRVEESNLRFTGEKPGWKTDRGMIYILLGEPLFVERSLEAEIWYYSFEEGERERSFRFNRYSGFDVPQIVERFELLRRAENEAFWRRTIERWRRGDEL